MPRADDLYPENGTSRVPSPAPLVDGVRGEPPSFGAGPGPLAAPDHQPWSATAMANQAEPASTSGPVNISPASSIHGDHEGNQQTLPGDNDTTPHDKDIPSAARDAWQRNINGDRSRQVPLLEQDPRWSLYDNIQDMTGDSPLTPRGQSRITASAIPLAPAQHWQGSREQQELEAARARSVALGRGPSITSYGPAPEPASGDDDIRPALVAPWRASNSPQESRQNRNRHGPFMHYEDIAYFDSEGEPKDEMEMTAVSRRETLAGLPESTTSRARRSWDRQRTRRRKKRPSPGTNGGSPTAGEAGQRGPKGIGIGRQIVAWAPEVLCSLFSILCLTVIVVILRIYDGRSLSNQPLSISLNAFIAFIEAACRISLVVPLTEGIAQLNWNSFARGERPLSDFPSFDNATRNPIGTASFIVRRKGRVLGMTAATALLTCFASSPLTQLSINISARLTTGFGTASVARSELYSHPEYLDTNDDLAPLETEAVQLGLNHPLTTPLLPTTPQCMTGNCAYPIFNTLAVCSATADVTSRLSLSEPILTTLLAAGLSPSDDDIIVHNASLPNGVLLVGGPASYNLNISSPSLPSSPNSTTTSEDFPSAYSSLAFAETDHRTLTAIANIFFIYTNVTGDVASPRRSFRAFEVLLHFCVNTYSVSVLQGNVTTALVNSTWDVTAISHHVGTRTAKMVLGAPDAEYAVDRDAARRLSGYMAREVAGTYAVGYTTNSGGVRGETGASRTLGGSLFDVGNEKVAVGDDGREIIANWTGNVATALTNAIRNAGSAATAVRGTTLIGETYFHIQWAWLAFLIAQVALSALFLVGIMIQTAVWKVPVIKGSGSAAATLLALSAEDRARLEGLSTAATHRGIHVDGDFYRRLQRVSCRFRPREPGWGLEVVGHEQLRDSGDNGNRGGG